MNCSWSCTVQYNYRCDEMLACAALCAHLRPKSTGLQLTRYKYIIPEGSAISCLAWSCNNVVVLRWLQGSMPVCRVC